MEEYVDFSITNCDKIFGIYKDNFLIYIYFTREILHYICKFQNKKPHFTSIKVSTNRNSDAKYFIAKGWEGLSANLKKWRFDL